MLVLEGMRVGDEEQEVTVVEPEADSDPSAPLFFLSYARMKPLKRAVLPHPDPNMKVQQLFNELSLHINNLVYRETGADPGFMDMTMRGSESWHEELSGAVGSCQVFVALLSPAYLARPWCVTEWNAFAGRKVLPRNPGTTRADHHETSILPVVWTSPSNYRVPEAISKKQVFTPTRLGRPNLAQQYQEDGLYGLLAGGIEGTEEIILRLAQRIVELYWLNRVEPGTVSDIDKLPRTFS